MGGQQLGEGSTVGKFGVAGERGAYCVFLCTKQSRLCFHTKKFTNTPGLYQMANTIIGSIMWPLDLISTDQWRDVIAYRSADCARDHHLVIAKTLLEPNPRGGGYSL